MKFSLSYLLYIHENMNFHERRQTNYPKYYIRKFLNGFL